MYLYIYEYVLNSNCINEISINVNYFEFKCLLREVCRNININASEFSIMVLHDIVSRSFRRTEISFA